VFLDHIKEISGEGKGFFGNMFGASYPKNYMMICKLLFYFLTRNTTDPVVSLALKEGKDVVAFWQDLILLLYPNQRFLQ
jgi:hypothetical protein